MLRIRRWTMALNSKPKAQLTRCLGFRVCCDRFLTVSCCLGVQFCPLLFEFEIETVQAEMWLRGEDGAQYDLPEDCLFPTD
jgi:hypothetical protein